VAIAWNSKMADIDAFVHMELKEAIVKLTRLMSVCRVRVNKMLDVLTNWATLSAFVQTFIVVKFAKFLIGITLNLHTQTKSIIS
jgi:hypothetical protein